MITFIPGLTQGSPSQALVQLAQNATRTNFEVQFNATQNAMLERFNERVEEFQNSDFGEAKTVRLRLKAASLERDLELARAAKSVVSSNRLTVKDLVTQLDELRSLADPGTVSEFEAKRTEVLETLDKLRAATGTILGAPDGLVGAKSNGLAAIEGIVTNSFATQADIDTVQDSIDTVVDELNASLTILEINQDIATNTISSKDRVLGQIDREIDAIQSAERSKSIDEIQALEQETANVLSNISLSFEASRFLTQYVADNLSPQTIEPGSVLNLFV